MLLSGLSGSGKSTIGGALMELLTEEHGRTVTLLDGDVVRTHLSAGLGFSRADRDVNVRRIGWVTAEVAKHGGLAVCAPIAPLCRGLGQRATDLRVAERRGRLPDIDVGTVPA